MAALVSAMVCAARPSKIEQKIAGIAVGTTTLEQAEDLLKKTIRMEEGIYKIRYQGGCELSLVLEDKRENPSKLRVMAVSLQRKDGGGHASASECNALTTGRGLSFGSSVGDVLRIYGQPTRDVMQNETRVLSYDNGAECRNPKLRSIQHKSLGVWWSERTGQIVEINIDTSTASCDEFRNYWNRPKRGGP